MLLVVIWTSYKVEWRSWFQEVSLRCSRALRLQLSMKLGPDCGMAETSPHRIPSAPNNVLGRALGVCSQVLPVYSYRTIIIRNTVLNPTVCASYEVPEDLTHIRRTSCSLLGQSLPKENLWSWIGGRRCYLALPQFCAWSSSLDFLHYQTSSLEE